MVFDSGNHSRQLGPVMELHSSGNGRGFFRSHLEKEGVILLILF